MLATVSCFLNSSLYAGTGRSTLKDEDSGAAAAPYARHMDAYDRKFAGKTFLSKLTPEILSSQKKVLKPVLEKMEKLQDTSTSVKRAIQALVQANTKLVLPSGTGLHTWQDILRQVANEVPVVASGTPRGMSQLSPAGQRLVNRIDYLLDREPHGPHSTLYNLFLEELAQRLDLDLSQLKGKMKSVGVSQRPDSRAAAAAE